MFKFDFFPAGDDEFTHGELGRRRISGSAMPGLEGIDFPVASAEDMVLAKLVWDCRGGAVSDRQWGDILSILQVQAARLDDAYLDEWGRKLGVEELPAKARREAEKPARGNFSLPLVSTLE